MPNPTILGIEVIQDQTMAPHLAELRCEGPRDLPRQVTTLHDLPEGLTIEAFTEARRFHILQHRNDPDVMRVHPDRYQEISRYFERLNARVATQPAHRMSTPAPERPPWYVSERDVEWPERGTYFNLTASAASERPYLNNEEEPGFQVYAGVDERGARLGCTLKIEACSLSRYHPYDPTMSPERRTQALRAMRLSLFKYLQARLREEFDREKREAPDVLANPPEPTPEAARVGDMDIRLPEGASINPFTTNGLITMRNTLEGQGEQPLTRWPRTAPSMEPSTAAPFSGLLDPVIVSVWNHLRASAPNAADVIGDAIRAAESTGVRAAVSASPDVQDETIDAILYGDEPIEGFTALGEPLPYDPGADENTSL